MRLLELLLWFTFKILRFLCEWGKVFQGKQGQLIPFLLLTSYPPKKINHLPFWTPRAQTVQTPQRLQDPELG